MKDKKIVIVRIIVFLLFWIVVYVAIHAAFTKDTKGEEEKTKEPVATEKTAAPSPYSWLPPSQLPTMLPTASPIAKSLIDPEGEILKTRILPPDGYTRKEASANSLAGFLRSYRMKPDQAPVLHYDGTPKVNQQAHVAVFTLPIENRDLQQCADSVMRIYAEYYWKQKAYDKIAFHFTNGFLATYSKWQAGYRIKVSGNQVSWVKSASYDDSYECFQKYLRIVFCYAGTMSMAGEAKPIDLKDIRVGDVFLKGGSPGHVVMIVDLCEDANGRKAFLLAQGYLPAQEFHVLKNSAHEENPWYYEDEVVYPFHTPQYTFEEGSLCRLAY